MTRNAVRLFSYSNIEDGEYFSLEKEGTSYTSQESDLGTAEDDVEDIEPDNDILEYRSDCSEENMALNDPISGPTIVFSMVQGGKAEKRPRIIKLYRRAGIQDL